MSATANIVYKQKKTSASLIFTGILLFFIHSLIAQNDINKKVLLLHSYHTQYAWTDKLTKAISNELKSELSPEGLFVEYLDGRHMMDNSLYFEALVVFYKQKYANIKFDAIICCDDYALEFLMKHKEDIFKQTPVIFGGINDMTKANKLNYQEYTGVFEGLPILKNLNLIVNSKKGINKIIILCDQSSLGRQMTAQAKEVLAKWTNKNVELIINNNFSFHNLIQETQVANNNTAYYILAIHQDNKGRYFSYQRDLPVIASKSKAPIFGMWGTLLIGYGATGGYINDPYIHGIEIANLTKLVLHGTKVGQIKPKLETIYKPRFDYNQMKKFNISIKDLPKNAIIYYKPDSYYKKHKKVIDTALVTFIALMILILILFITIRKQKAHNNQLNILTKELQKSNEHLHHFSYVTSHQLRSSSINMNMLLNYYKEECIDDIQKQWVWHKINETSISIQNIVDDIAKILALKKIKNTTEFKDINIKEICNKILLPFECLIKNGNLIINYDFIHTETIFTHKEVITEILTIFIENSIKYKPIERILTLNINTEKINNIIKLNIKDNGNGLPIAYEKKIFELYQRGHENIQGKGLGLYMAKLLANSIQTVIESKNLEDNKGVKFTLVFNKDNIK